MTPSSSGWRRASSTVGGNSASSSRNRTPPCARLTSPGPHGLGAAADQRDHGGGVVRGPERRPPDQAAAERHGPRPSGLRVASMRLRCGRASGSSPGRRLASMVLPAPGGPIMSRWWPPAAAISRALRTTGWPRTSARSRTAARRRAACDRRRAWSGHGSSPVEGSEQLAAAWRPAGRAGPRPARHRRRPPTGHHHGVGAEGVDERHDAGHRAHRAVEPELADEADVPDRLGVELLRWRPARRRRWPGRARCRPCGCPTAPG